MASRIEKYKRNYNSKRVGAAYETSKERAVEKEKIATEKLVYIEEAIKRIADGQPIIHLPYYIIFGKEIYSKTLKHESETLWDEICILEKKWRTRGLAGSILEEIEYLLAPDYRSCLTIPFDARVIWTGTNAGIPAGWTRDTDFDTRFMQGSNAPGANGGAASHNHVFDPHTHTGDPHSHVQPALGPSLFGLINLGGLGNAVSVANHKHTHNASVTQDATITYQNTVATIQTTGALPASIKFILIKPDDGNQLIPVDGIALSDDPTVPTNFFVTDGNNGTTDLDDFYLLGADVGGDGGAGVGSSSHFHNSNLHNHTANNHNHVGGAIPISNQNSLQTISRDVVGSLPTHHTTPLTGQTATTINAFSISVNATPNEPSFHQLLGIQNKGLEESLPIHVILPFLGSSIPNGWALCDGTNGTPDLSAVQIKVTATPAAIGTLGGSNTHTHATNPHTHSSFGSHNHTWSFGNNNNQDLKQLGANTAASSIHSHFSVFPVYVDPETPTLQHATATMSAVDARSPYRTVRFIKKQ